MKKHKFIVQTVGEAHTTHIESDFFKFNKGGVLSFWDMTFDKGNRIDRLVMAYPPHAWKSVSQEVPNEKQGV